MESFTVGSEFWCGTGDKIEGKRREVAAEVFRMKGWLGCRIRSPLCSMGDQPFESLIHADFDHIDGDRLNHRLGNLQPACHSCNSHKQKHQWKSLPEATTPQNRERVSAAPPSASSLESAKHDPQRAAWDSILAASAWTALKDAGTMTLTSESGTFYLASDLAEIAVKLTVDPVYGKYSSETFMRYAREDRFDTLEMIKDKGRWWVRLR